MARKGAMLMDGKFKGKPFQIIGTHLQAAGDNVMRLQQATELAEKLLKPNYKKGVPQLICGDMNIPQKSAGYPKLLDIYEVEGYNYPAEVTGTNTVGTLYIIDYIFVRDNDTQINELERSMIIPRREWGPGQDWLSDHHGILLKISF